MKTDEQVLLEWGEGHINYAGKTYSREEFEKFLGVWRVKVDHTINKRVKYITLDFCDSTIEFKMTLHPGHSDIKFFRNIQNEVNQEFSRGKCLRFEDLDEVIAEFLKVVDKKCLEVEYSEVVRTRANLWGSWLTELVDGSNIREKRVRHEKTGRSP